jgi:hypothetical protein
MTTQASFDPPQVHTGSPEDYLVLGVLLAASVLAQLFLAERNRHADNVYSPRLAWMRALLYFSVILVISWTTGVLKVLVHAPFVQSGDLANSVWLVLTGVWLLALVWGYGYWWPRGTLTLVLWAVIEEFGFARWGTALLVFFVLAGYGQIYQSGWWDIHVSPPHNIRATNAKKVLFGHMPFLCIALAHFTLFGNVFLFVAFHAAALACSAVAMRFPPFWEKDGPVVSKETALGV